MILAWGQPPISEARVVRGAATCARMRYLNQNLKRQIGHLSGRCTWLLHPTVLALLKRQALPGNLCRGKLENCQAFVLEQLLLLL
jgi:hypothetical protein